MRKVTINEEIENLKSELNGREDTHPDYISPELKDLQGKVLATHAHLELTLENRILHQIALEEDIKRFAGRQRLFAPLTALKLMESVSFKNKLEIVKGFKDGISFRILEKVNSYRNEFAHPKGLDLRGKYNYNTARGKINIRDLLRSLAQGNREMDMYVLKIFSDKKHSK